MIKHALTGIAVAGCIWMLAGCAEVVVPGSLAGGGEVYRYTTGNVAKRTFVSNVGRLTAAAHEALEKMGIHYESTRVEDSETEMKASTDNLAITITLQPITAASTRVSVNAAEKTVFKDKATAAEIIHQIDLALHRKAPPDPSSLPGVFVKNGCHRPIDIVVYYLADDNGSSAWQTRGWFMVEPGQTKHVADTQNRYIYFYGESRSRNKKIWTGNHPQWFEGRHYDFFKVDMGTRLVDYTYSFSCE